jgi:hypothetical protein
VPVARGLGGLDLGAKRESKSFARRIGETENSHNSRRGHLEMGTQTTRHLQHTRSLPAQGSLRPPPQHASLWSKLWNLKHWPKITLFLWLVAHSSILTWDNLSKRGFVGPSMCLLCGEAEETMEHLLNSCHYTAQLWDQAGAGYAHLRPPQGQHSGDHH